MQTKLSFQQVSKRYTTANGGEAIAIQNVSLEVATGRFVCLLGPSGCGKSTLLNMAAGFIQPSSGQILLDGRAIQGPGAERGVVFQEYALFPWYTVAENVALGPHSKGLSRRECNELADHFLGLVGLSNHRHKYPKELSGGMKQRAALARTLANDPAVILMDEPFGALDAQTREELQQELLDLWQATSKTILFVTHSIEEAVLLGDMIALFAANPGRLLHLFDNPLARPRQRTSAEVTEIGRLLYEQRYGK